MGSKCKGEKSACSGFGELSQLCLSNSSNLLVKHFLWNIHASVRALIPLHRISLWKRESNWAAMVLGLWHSNLHHCHFHFFCDSILSYYWQTHLIFFYDYWLVYSIAVRQCWSERKSTVISICDAQVHPKVEKKSFYLWRNILRFRVLLWQKPQ